MRYDEDGKIFVTEPAESKMVEEVRIRYVTAEEFLKAIGVDTSPYYGKRYFSQSSSSSAIRYRAISLRDGKNGFEPHQWEKLKELHKKIVSPTTDRLGYHISLSN